MKRKRLALLLAVALTVTSVESTALVVSAADFTAASSAVELEADEPEMTENQETDEEIAGTSTEDVSEDTADVEFSDGNDMETEEEMADREEARAGENEEEPELISEENEADFVSTGKESVVPDEGVTKMVLGNIYTVNNNCGWFSFTPEEDGLYYIYSIGNEDTVVTFFENKEDSGYLKHGGGTGCNFKLVRELKAGKTYYYRATTTVNSIDAGSFEVCLERTKSVIPEEGVRNIDLGKRYTVNIVDPGDDSWFSFTPEKDGNYDFYSIGDHKTLAFLFDGKHYDGTLDSYNYWDSEYSYSGGSGDNFKFTKQLKAGVTYYFCAKMYNDDDAGSFEVGIQKTKSVVPDEGICEMAVNGVYDVDIEQENECKWFSFMPEEDGEYSFYATGSYETEGYYFDSKEYTKTLEWYKGTYDQYDSNSGPDNNFKFNKTLKAGVTYYYCVKMSNYDTGSFNVKLVKTKVLQSIQATLKQTKIEAGVYDGNSGLGYIQSYLEATVQYKFTDGTIEVAEKQMGEEWVPRTESLETATIDIVDSEGNEQSDRLSKGKYAAVFSVDNIKSEPVEFQVVDVEDTSVYYGILHEGDNPGTKTPENNRAYYKFIPSQTGTYIFKNCADCSLYEKDENGILRHPDHEDGVSPVQQAGKEYYIRLSGEVWSDDTQDYEEECNLNIRMQRTITSISFVPENTEVYNNIDNIENNWTQIGGNITLTYNDGSVWSGDVERCQLGYSDDDGNWLDTIIKDEEGHTVLGYGGLSAGIYQVYLKYRDVKSNEYTLRVVETFDYDKAPKLMLESNNIVDESGKWYAFEPDVSGIYADKFDKTQIKPTWYYAYEGDDRWSELSDAYWLNGNEHQLEAGVRYLVYLKKNSISHEKELNYILSKKSAVTKVEVKSYNPSLMVFIKELEKVNVDGVSAEVTFEDQSKHTVVPYEEDEFGRYLCVELMRKTENGDYESVDFEDEVTAGNYVYRVFYRESSYSEVYAEDIPVKVVSAADISELVINKENKLTASKGDIIVLKLNTSKENMSEENSYIFDTAGTCYIRNIREASNGEDVGYKENGVDLKKDTLYYVYAYVNDENPTITVRNGMCQWKETAREEATCTEDGFVTETCSVHGETRTEVLEKLGHNLGKRQIIKASTCGVPGESARICINCKGKFEKQTIKATGKHKYSSWKTTKASTALAEGQKERTCSVCKKKETQKTARLKATLTLNIAAKKSLPLKLNRSYKVNVQMTKGDSIISWRSSNAKAVKVDKYGKVTGKQAGKTARITVKLRSGLTTWFDVKVQKNNVATTSLKLKNASTGKYMANNVTLKRSQKLKVTPVIAPVTSTQAVSYTSSNKKVATVDSRGQITAKARGTAYITAKSGRKNVKIKITVK